jgi:hypothetical protein
VSGAQSTGFLASLVNDPNLHPGVDETRWNEPFAIALAFLDAFVEGKVGFGEVERDFQECVTDRTFVAVEGHVRQPHALPSAIREVVAGTVFEAVSENRFGVRGCRSMEENRRPKTPLHRPRGHAIHSYVTLMHSRDSFPRDFDEARAPRGINDLIVADQADGSVRVA